MDKAVINEILGIKESIELPYKIRDVMSSGERVQIFERFINEEPDLSYDWFSEYFQQEQADRRELKQDYTPDCLCRFLANICPESKSVLDVCAGSGSLTISIWNENKDAFFQCEELSDRVFPLLLFNMAIRNMSGICIQKDVLTGEVRACFVLKSGERFSNVSEDQPFFSWKHDLVVMNPPYSLKCQVVSGYDEFQPLPTDKADYIFILYGLERLKEGGAMFAILPHGVLFRGSKEGEIRKKLLDKKKIRTLIGMPDKLFMNTGIPICIMEYRDDSDLYIIDASEFCEKHGRNNVITESQRAEIAAIYGIRKSVEGTSKVVPEKEIEDNDYNLNIPRYVSRFEQVEREPLDKLISDLAEIDGEIREAEKEFLSMLKQLTSESGEVDAELKRAADLYGKMVIG